MGIWNPQGLEKLTAQEQTQFRDHLIGLGQLLIRAEIPIPLPARQWLQDLIRECEGNQPPVTFQMAAPTLEV